MRVLEYESTLQVLRTVQTAREAEMSVHVRARTLKQRQNVVHVFHDGMTVEAGSLRSGRTLLPPSVLCVIVHL